MPTQIIDGFKLSSSTPIDSRMVASGSIARNSIQYKYEGLKVYDTSDKITYVWGGTDWVQDGGGSGGSGAGGGGVYIGVVNRIPKYFAGGLTNSVIYDSSTSNTIRVGIGKSAFTYALEVNGTIQGSTLIGSYDGKGLIESSVLVNKIEKPTVAGTYVLKSIGSKNQWVLESTSALSVGVANNTTLNPGYLTFTSGSSAGSSLSINNVSGNKAIALDASTSQLLASSDTTNSSSKPGYSFLGASSTGLYASTTEVGISLGGSKTIYSTSTSTKISVAGLEVAKFEGTAIFLNKGTTISGGTTTITGGLLVASTFGYTFGTPGTGKVLTSDSTGNALWSSLGMPYGTIIMWAFDAGSIPPDFKICNGVGFIFVNGAYKAIPDLRDRNISASSDNSTGPYGSLTPTTQQTVTLSNSHLPQHYHSIDTAVKNYAGENGGAIVAAWSTFTETTNGGAGHTHTLNSRDGCADNSSSRNFGSHTGDCTRYTGYTKITGSVTTSLDGYTGGLTRWQGAGNVNQPFAVPFLRGYKLIFLIKFNPDANASQSGHYKAT
jgi:hypothetical protein